MRTQKVIAVILAAALLISGCGPVQKTENQAQAGGLMTEQKNTNADAALSEDAQRILREMESREAAEQQKYRTEYSEYWDSDGKGGEWVTPAGEAKGKEQYKKEDEIRTKLEAYLAAHPDGKLAQHFSGIWHPNSWDDVVVRFDDIEDPEILKELESVGIVSDYRLERWSGSRQAGEAAEKQLKEAFEALKAKAVWNAEEKLLMTKYRPEIGSYQGGMIGVTLHCDTPWYQQVSTEDMKKDRAVAISLFEKYIGKYEFVVYGFPV